MAAWRSIMGVVDSIMFPGTLAFSRFDYPSALPEGVQARMAEIAATPDARASASTTACSISR